MGLPLSLPAASSEGDSYSNFRQLFLVRPDGTDLEAVPNTVFDRDWSCPGAPTGSALLYVER